MALDKSKRFLVRGFFLDTLSAEHNDQSFLTIQPALRYGRQFIEHWRRDDEDDETSVMEDKEEKEKKPWKCLEGSNGYFIYKNMAENWCGLSPQWGECSVAMEQ